MALKDNGGEICCYPFLFFKNFQLNRYEKRTNDALSMNTVIFKASIDFVITKSLVRVKTLRPKKAKNCT